MKKERRRTGRARAKTIMNIREFFGKNGLNEKDFNAQQTEQIEKGLKNRLEMRKMLVFARPEIEPLRMREMRRGLEDGLDLNKVIFYSNPKYDSAQMRSIRHGFEDGLSYEELSPLTRIAG